MQNWKAAMARWLSLATLILMTALLPGGALVSAARGGTGPDTAIAPSGDWQSIGPGANHWYSFYYMGDGSALQIRLEVVPEEGANFALWTPQDYLDWAAGAEVEPVGRGSPDPSAGGALLWAGRFYTAGTYYVLVEHTSTQPGASYYLLRIEGEGVSFAPPPAPTAKPSGESKAQGKPAAPAPPSGTLVFQTGIDAPIYTIQADGSGLQRITSGMDPTWSPDGRQIALVRWQEPRGVWVTNADGSGERRIFDWSEPRWTTWSPDGKQVMFTRVTGGRQEPVEFCFRGFCFTFPATPHWAMGVVRMQDLSFYEPPPPDTQTSRAPDWSPDGGRVVFADIQGLRVQTLDREVSYMITSDSRDTSPAWSPDGRSVAFVRRQHDHWELYLVSADGGNPRRLTDTPRKPNGQVAHSASPAWSPDGQYLAFLTDRSGKWEIWVMRADGSGQKPMFKTALAGLRLEYTHLGERAISWTR